MDSTEEHTKVIKQKDALTFLDDVRSEFPDDNNKVYQEFIAIMVDFRNKEIGTKQVLERTMQLFMGHHSLIQNFLQFLPPGHVLQKPKDLHDSTCIEITTPSGDLIIVDSTRGIVE
ncbi:uncharacterized protein EV154DRAFT_492808 [Mucor mucedo]|uniref:uncharacterized protein n=1 Tax=Mucor mucedo TaxID=29922 RepID=UPI00221F2BF7|nr:uncharacterized protein EV154DRAFT_492808 [Mucor mucedo]KAI7896258.1 hypothetical protein EV154DRAFT_492808 [Mucor mucedo]